MGSHPINLAVRFLLELSALLAMGVWGWRQNESACLFILNVTGTLTPSARTNAASGAYNVTVKAKDNGDDKGRATVLAVGLHLSVKAEKRGYAQRVCMGGSEANSAPLRPAIDAFRNVQLPVVVTSRKHKICLEKKRSPAESEYNWR